MRHAKSPTPTHPHTHIQIKETPTTRIPRIPRLGVGTRRVRHAVHTPGPGPVSFTPTPCGSACLAQHGLPSRMLPSVGSEHGAFPPCQMCSSMLQCRQAPAQTHCVTLAACVRAVLLRHRGNSPAACVLVTPHTPHTTPRATHCTPHHTRLPPATQVYRRRPGCAGPRCVPAPSVNLACAVRCPVAVSCCAQHIV